jgi:hypothetical protein
MQNGQRWGEMATLSPGWGRVGNAALTALKAPEVWLPAVGALALQVNDYDEDISDWALDHHPIFNDEDDASDASDNLRALSYIAYGTSFLATPSGPVDGQWITSKAKALGVGLSAYGLTDITVNYLKDNTDRNRPDDSNDRSFPSAHASQTAVYSILADRNMRVMDIPRWAKISSKVSLTALPLATGWARVEAAKHYPADVLAGMALGHFFGLFMHDAFLGVDHDLLQLTIEPNRNGWYAGISMNY